MIGLEIYLLLVGLIISIITLIKLESSKDKITKGILSIAYILGFIVSIILIILKYNETEESALTLFTSLSTIEKTITEQSTKILTISDRIKDLKIRMDTVVTKTEVAILQRERIQKNFVKQNEILEKSNELTQKQIDERKPTIITYTKDVTFKPSDSLTTLCRILIRNEGKRTANQLGIKIMWLFKDKNDTYFYHIPHQDSSKVITPSNSKIFDVYLPIKYDNLFSMTNGGIIMISLNYKDELTNEYIPIEFLFRMEIEKDKIKIYELTSLPNEVMSYLKKAGNIFRSE